MQRRQARRAAAHRVRQVGGGRLGLERTQRCAQPPTQRQRLGHARLSSISNEVSHRARRGLRNGSRAGRATSRQAPSTRRAAASLSSSGDSGRPQLRLLRAAKATSKALWMRRHRFRLSQDPHQGGQGRSQTAPGEGPRRAVPSAGSQGAATPKLTWLGHPAADRSAATGPSEVAGVSHSTRKRAPGKPPTSARNQEPSSVRPAAILGIHGQIRAAGRSAPPSAVRWPPVQRHGAAPTGSGHTNKSGAVNFSTWPTGAIFPRFTSFSKWHPAAEVGTPELLGPSGPAEQASRPAVGKPGRLLGASTREAGFRDHGESGGESAGSGSGGARPPPALWCRG